MPEIELIEYVLSRGISGLNLLILIYICRCVFKLSRDVEYIKGHLFGDKK